VFGHNLFDGIRFADGTWQHYLWSALHQKNVLALPFDLKVRTTYPFLPIAGLMCLAYIAGRYYVKQGFSKKTEKRALLVGVLCLAVYAILRGFNLYGDTSEFSVHDTALHTVMDFLNPTKYPLSLQFMLITVGCGLIALYFLKKLPADFSQDFLQLLGKTSMFSYIAHLYLLHLFSWLLIPILGYRFGDMTYGETLIGLPEGYGFTFEATLAFAVVVLIVNTLLAKWYIDWKSNNKHTLVAKYI